MGKASKWLRSFLTGKKQKENCASNQNPTSPISVPPATPKDKRRWSFRRSHATAPAAKDLTSTEPPTVENEQARLDSDYDGKKHDMAMVKATAAAADAALAAAQAAAAVIRLNERAVAIEAATKIQSAFRSYLARRALIALKGLVKLQALVRGHLVRKQATVTLRCMQALITAQARARAQRIQAIQETRPQNQRPSSAHRRSTQDRLRLSTYNDMDRGLEEIIKIIEMDLGESKHRTSNSTRHAEHCRYSKQDDYKVSPTPSALTDMSPRGHFKDYGFSTAQSSPQCHSAVPKLDSARSPFAFPPPEYTESRPCNCSLFPNYMTNTESSRAKARSQSVPKQRTSDSFERSARRRRASMEGRAVEMHRSSSHVGATARNYQYPWLIKLDKSARDSECGSTSTMHANDNCRPVAGYDSHGIVVDNQRMTNKK